MLIITGFFFKFSCCLGAAIAKQCTGTERKKASFDGYCCHWIVIANEISLHGEKPCRQTVVLSISCLKAISSAFKVRPYFALLTY